MSRFSFKKKFLPLYLLVPVLFLLTFFLFYSGRDNRNFNKLTDTIFKRELIGNTLNLHYTLAYPDNYGINHYNPTLPCYSKEAQLQSEQEVSGYLDKLQSIDIHKLNENNQYVYILLNRYLQQEKEGNTFAYYSDVLSPSSGMQSELPILFAEYTFRNKQDIDDYLALLDQTDDYFLSLLTFEQEKKEVGLLPADSSLIQVQDQCYTILTSEELDNGTHFLQTTFQERLQLLVEQQVITEDEFAEYQAQNNRLLKTVMKPAYEALADGLFLLMGDGTSLPKGLSSKPDGKEYYEWLVRKNTGSSLSIKEIKALLYPQFDESYEALRELLLSREDAVTIWSDTVQQDPVLLYTPDEMLANLQSQMKTDFPPLPTKGLSATTLPGLSVKSVSSSMQDYCAPAFYLTPPLDDTENNVIYINEKSTTGGLSLYTTLAHEGYPGHLYQSVFHQLTMQKQDISPVRQILWYGGYQEGWAVYVEFISYDYAAALANKQGNTDAAFAYQVEKRNRNVQLCLYAVLDVAIHYDGATYEQVHQVLSKLGISNTAATRRIYDYIAEEPGNYLKYYLGYLQILKLKEEALTLWGNEYSDLRFHTFFLNCGPSDFTSLSEALVQE
ncbi:MAG TPA: DUF885 domain-containing protein [Lachnospiraceae bacterium]|nr:DUF885 domain-containing protein [Lachnospiraceae bacterium]